MAKQPSLSDVSNINNAASTINNNNSLIEEAFDNTLSRDGSTPNEMEADLDLNSNDLLNVKDAHIDRLLLAGQTVVSTSYVPAWRGDWATGVDYNVNDLVKREGDVYISTSIHTSSGFSTDLSNGLLELFVEKGASGGGTGDMLAANNLSDVVDEETSRENIGLGSADDVEFGSIDSTGAIKRGPSSSDDKPFINISNTADGDLPKAHVWVRHNSTERTDTNTVFIQRNVSTAEGHVNPHALDVEFNTTGTADPGSRPWAISAEMTSGATSVTSGEAGTALSGVARKTASNNGVLFGGHVQAKDETDAATLGGLIGLEVNIQGNGADTNSNRIGLDLIARTFAGGSSGPGRYTAAIRIRNDSSTSGKWLTGVSIGGASGIEQIDTGIKIQNSIDINNGQGVFDEGTKLYGLRANGVYGAAGVAVASDQYMEMGVVGGTSRIRMKYNTSTDKIEFYKAGVLKASIDMGSGASGADMN